MQQIRQFLTVLEQIEWYQKNRPALLLSFLEGLQARYKDQLDEFERNHEKINEPKPVSSKNTPACGVREG